MDYRKKTFWLMAGFALMVVLSYVLAFKKTMDLKAENDFFIVSVETMASNEAQLEERIAQLSEMDSLLTDQGSNNNPNTYLLESISVLSAANNIRIKSISDPRVQWSGPFAVQTVSFRLEGDYIPMLRLIHELEKKPLMGRIASANFMTETSGQSKKKKLYCDLYVQRYESTRE